MCICRTIWARDNSHRRVILFDERGTYYKIYRLCNVRVVNNYTQMSHTLFVVIKGNALTGRRKVSEF